MDLLASHITSGDRPSMLDEATIRDTARDLDLASDTSEAAALRIDAALDLVRRAPDHLAPQALAATLFERARRREDMLDTWTALHKRHPRSHTALRYRLRWLGRESRTDEAISLLERRFAEAVAQGEDLTRQAELYGELRDKDAADRLFQTLIAHDPENIRIRVIYGKALFSRGDIVSAFDVLDPLRSENLSPTARAVVERNDRAILAMEAIEENSTFATNGTGTVLRNAISLFRDRIPRPINPDQIGGVRLYTGSLGPGGAERQLSQLAEMLHRRAVARRNVYGTRIRGPVEVIVNHADPTKNKDFFRPALERADVTLKVAKETPPLNLDELARDREEFADLMPLLPRNARFGLERLYADLNAGRPDVFYIWQDGAVLTGALAALIAGVPRIVISLRGLPPSMRPHLMKPEYLDMYQALADVPGVSFSCNSSVAADAYADWTGIPRERFSVIYNAIQPHPTDGASEDMALWQAFEDATPDATMTLGGLFRFTPNKRGLLWIEWAAELLKRHPTLRFVLVGAGVEFAAAEHRAQTLGIDDRILFTGASDRVGFWLDKMDVLSLLSENEGLPNTLIEAQVAGIPVISTPAGGAAETMLHGRTGYLMSSAETPSLSEYIMFFDKLIAGRPGLAVMGKQAEAHARAKFDIDRVLAQTVRFFLGERIEASEEADMPNVTDLAGQRGPVVVPAEIKHAYGLFANGPDSKADAG